MSLISSNNKKFFTRLLSILFQYKRIGGYIGETIDEPIRGIVGGVIIVVIGASLTGCTKSEILSSEPSLIDLDSTSPTCPGLTSVEVSSGPSLSLMWSEASDNVSQSSNITYSVFIRSQSGSYDPVSPSKIVIGATSALITSGIQLGQRYYLYVTCKDEAGNVYPKSPSNEKNIMVTDQSPPSTITTLIASNPSYSSLLLTWSPSDDGSGGTTSSQMVYKGYYSTSSPVSTSGSPFVELTGVTSYTHSGLLPNTTYYYKVISQDIAGNLSEASNQASTTTLTDNTAPYFSPNSGLAKGTITTSTIALSWNAATDNVTPTGSITYAIYRCSGSTTCDPYASSIYYTTAAGATSFIDSGLSSNTIYVYGVRARDSSSNLSSNTEKVVSSTNYSSTGSFYSYSTGEQMGIRFGTSVAIANVIGVASGAGAYPDLIVGAPNASEPGSTYINTGCVFIFQGTGVGTFATTPTQLICQPNPSANGANNRNFGYNLVTDDLDGDGISDLVVTSPNQNRFIIYRTTNTSGTLSIGGSSTSISYASGGTQLGYGVCTGDSDGVGANDIFITSSAENCTDACGRTATGVLLLYNNISSAGNFVIPTLNATKINVTNSLLGAGYTIANSEQVIRSCVFGNFDPNTPAQNQLILGSGTAGYGATVNDGIVSFLRKTGADTYSFQNALRGNLLLTTGAQWGDALLGLQLDSGVKELYVGAPLDSSPGPNAGAAYGYSISMSGANFTLNDTGQSYIGGTDQNNNGAGQALAAGNIFGHTDGKQDLVLGANLDDNTFVSGATGLDLGDVFTYRNYSGVITTTVQQTSFDPTSSNAKTGLRYGQSLCSGDVNNDGFMDVIVGSAAESFDPLTLTSSTALGAVYIYYGKSSGEIDFVNPSQILYSPGDHANGYFGVSCTVLDFNGDGYKDLVVGSPYRDVGSTDRGIVFVYYGSSNSALPSSYSDVLVAPATAPQNVSPFVPTTSPFYATANVFFGYSLAKGDFDNNGYEDLAVGSPYFDSWATVDTGSAWVFWAADSAPHAIMQSTYTFLYPPNGNAGTANNLYMANNFPSQASMYFGYAMGAFRSVSNSTGVDLVVCAPWYNTAASDIDAAVGALTDIGTCFIYEGKVNADLVGSYQMMVQPKNEIRYPYAYTSYGANTQTFGTAIETGDWDYDGNLDLVICASSHRNLLTSTNNAGACFMYKGKAGGGFQTTTGYRPNATSTRYSPVADDVYYNPLPETNATKFGESVLLLDINNNGRPDLIIGEPYSDNFGGPSNMGSDSGRVYILRGGF